MAKKLLITGAGILDETQRFEALQDLQKEATTPELLKLQKAMANPKLRGMLNMI